MTILNNNRFSNYNLQNDACFSSLLESSTDDLIEGKILASSKIFHNSSHRKANTLRNSHSAVTSPKQDLKMKREDFLGTFTPSQFKLSVSLRQHLNNRSKINKNSQRQNLKVRKVTLSQPKKPTGLSTSMKMRNKFLTSARIKRTPMNTPGNRQSYDCMSQPSDTTTLK